MAIVYLPVLWGSQYFSSAQLIRFILEFRLSVDGMHADLASQSCNYFGHKSERPVPPAWNGRERCNSDVPQIVAETQIYDLKTSSQKST